MKTRSAQKYLNSQHQCDKPDDDKGSIKAKIDGIKNDHETSLQDGIYNNKFKMKKTNSLSAVKEPKNKRAKTDDAYFGEKDDILLNADIKAEIDERPLIKIEFSNTSIDPNHINHSIDKSDESDWEEVGEEVSAKNTLMQDFDKQLIEKITNEEQTSSNPGTSYMDVMPSESVPAPTVKSNGSNEPIQISLPTGHHKVKYEPGLTEEEKRKNREEMRRKIQIQRKLKHLERIHKTHLLCLLAHVHYVNGVCNEPSFRNLLVTTISSPSKSAVKTEHGGRSNVSGKGGRRTMSNRLTSESVDLTIGDQLNLTSPKVPSIYSSLKNKIDVPAVVHWIQNTFSSESFQDPTLKSLVSEKSLLARLMICAYKRVNPECLVSARLDSSLTFRKKGKQQVSALDPTCRIGYLNLIAVALLRSLGIETRLVANLVPTPLKLTDGGREKKATIKAENDAPVDKKGGKNVNRLPIKEKQPSNAPKTQCLYPCVQYWLEARLEQDPCRPVDKKSKGANNMRWITINCVKSSPLPNSPPDLPDDADEASPSLRRGRRKVSTKGTQATPSLKVSPYFEKSKSQKGSNHTIDGPEYVVRTLKLPKTISYVLAISEKSYVRDITVKYASDWHINGRKLRIGSRSEEHGWWHETLDRFNSTFSTESYHVVTGSKRKGRKMKSEKGIKKELDKLEENEILAVSQKRPLPTTINEYKDHPLYVLKRHLLRNQAIYPPYAKPVGYVRNEHVYSRDHMHTLKAPINWLKDDARLVRLDEKGYKLVLKRPSFKEMRRKRLKDSLAKGAPLIPQGPALNERQDITEDALGDENELKNIVSDPGEKEKEELFGIWQTDPYIPPPVVNGKIPRNTFGNVELFQMSMLPIGTVYVRDLPGLNKVALKLGLECVPAFRGWEFSRCNARPVLDGWVILKQDQERLLDEWDKYQVENQLAEFQKREKMAIENWRKFTRALLIKKRIQAKYGSNHESPLPIKEEFLSGTSKKPVIRKKRGTKGDENKEILSTVPADSPWGEKSMKALPNTVLDLASYQSNSKI